MSLRRESWAVAYGTCSGLAVGVLLSRLLGTGYFAAAVFGAFALVALIIGTGHPGESSSHASADQ